MYLLQTQRSIARHAEHERPETWKKSSLNGTSPSVTFPQNSINPSEEEAERIQEPEIVEDDKEARSSKSTYIKLI